MRKVPVLVNGDDSRIVGWLHLDDTISDEEVADCTVSWSMLLSSKNTLLSMALIPKLVNKE